jgi:hypothetical protein
VATRPNRCTVNVEEIMRNMFIALLLLAASPAFAQDKEKLSAVDLSVRVGLTFKVADAVVQKFLPAGFELNSPTAGPTKGYNFGMTFIDYLMAQDPEGKALPPRPTVVMNMPAKKTATGEAVGIVFGGFIAQAGVPGPYFVNGPAKINVERRSHAEPDGKSTIEENWEIMADDGSALALQLQFVRGVPARGKVEAKLHSAAKPDFYRIYKFEQAADVVRSAATGVDRASKFSIKATGPRFAPLFDGSEQLISITSVPYYSRSIYVPAM